MKRLIALLLSCTLVISGLAGCSTKKEEPAASTTKTEETKESEKTQETKSETEKNEADTAKASGEKAPKAYKIAVPYPETGALVYQIFANNGKIFADVTGGEMIHNVPAESTADGYISFVESSIAAGMDGIIFTPPTDSILPTICSLCEEAGVYWGLAFRPIMDDDIRALCEKSPYYTGTIIADDEEIGYQTASWIGKQGYKKIAILSQARGDTTCDAREVGLERACKEYGMEIVGEGRALAQASDVASAVESFLASNPDLDCIFSVGSTAGGWDEAVVKTIKDSGRTEVKLVSVDFPNRMVDNFKDEIQVYAYGNSCLTYATYIALLKVINAIEGTPINDDGSSSIQYVTFRGIDNIEEASKYKEALTSTYEFYDSEYILNTLCKWNNKELNSDVLQEIIDAFDPLTE